jgi:hypothetical protein
MVRKAAPTGEIVKLKVTLQGISPPIWRRLLIPAAMTLRDLHEILQTSMGWHDAHLHDFDIAGKRFGDPATTEEVENEARMTLDRVHKAGATRFKYNYDFGDDWEHLIVIEATVPRAAGQHYPACVAGKRACPPEDCGGVWGYHHLLEVMADPAHPEHEDMSEWVNEDFDPESFSVEATDAMLARQFAPVIPAKR